MPPPAAEQAVIAAITVVLLANLPPAVLLIQLSALLAPLGIAPAAIAQVLSTLLSINRNAATFDLPAPGRPSALGAIRRGSSARRASYLSAAFRRLSSGATIGAEQRFARAHLVAERRRNEAGRAVDAAAAAHGPILGWRAVNDERTTPLCRAAHGRNFRAIVPPAIGYPGTLHGGNCRCTPSAPWARGVMLA